MIMERNRDGGMTVRKAAGKIVSDLSPMVGNGEAKAIAEMIFHHLKGWGRTQMLIHDDQCLSEFVWKEISEILDKVKLGVPVQYATGEAYFYGMWLKVDQRVLIPRPETAELVDMIVDEAGDRADLNVLDVAAGSGCISIALARNLRFPHVEGIDLSSGALDVARMNARTLRADVAFEMADMTDFVPDEGKYDIIVSNPPYICEREESLMESTVKDYEPRMALFVPDDDPLMFYRPLARIASRGLRDGGRLYLEITPVYAADVVGLLEDHGMGMVRIHTDIHGKNRFVTALKTDKE